VILSLPSLVGSATTLHILQLQLGAEHASRVLAPSLPTTHDIRRGNAEYASFLAAQQIDDVE
jgi:hypothetical protein